MTEFLTMWRHIPAHLSPNLLEIGSFQLRYYSLMYLVAFAIVYFLTLYRMKNENNSEQDDEHQI